MPTQRQPALHYVSVSEPRRACENVPTARPETLDSESCRASWPAPDPYISRHSGCTSATRIHRVSTSGDHAHIHAFFLTSQKVRRHVHTRRKEMFRSHLSYGTYDGSVDAGNRVQRYVAGEHDDSTTRHVKLDVARTLLVNGGVYVSIKRRLSRIRLETQLDKATWLKARDCVSNETLCSRRGEAVVRCGASTYLAPNHCETNQPLDVCERTCGHPRLGHQRGDSRPRSGWWAVKWGQSGGTQWCGADTLYCPEYNVKCGARVVGIVNYMTVRSHYPTYRA